MRVEKFGRDWLEKNADYFHRQVIGKQYVQNAAVADFALVTFDEKNLPISYCTVRLIGGMAFMPFGGTLPDFRGKRVSQKAFNMMVDELISLKKFVGFECKQDNRAMLILGLKKGFYVTGVRSVDGFILVQMVLESKGEKYDA